MHAKEHEVSTIGERVKKIVVEQLDVNEREVYNTTALIVDDLGADSLACVELRAAVEKEFEIKIPEEEAEKLTTVQALIDYVTYRVAGG